MISKDIKVKSSNALILGITFKENCPDIRNSKVPVIYNDLKSFGLNVDVYDPYANPQEVNAEFGINLLGKIDKKYELIVLAVSHENLVSLDFKKLRKQNSVIFDLKSVLDKSIVDSDRYYNFFQLWIVPLCDKNAKFLYPHQLNNYDLFRKFHVQKYFP